MFDLERTKRTITTLFGLSAFSLILAFVGFAHGGGELLVNGYMNRPTPTILMFVSVGIFVLSLITGVGFKALSKDIIENLKYIDSKK